MTRRPWPLLLPLVAAAPAPALPSLPSPPPPRPAQRIVSLNLCADQYLIALADRRQIAGLTRFARDPLLSAAAVEARSYPVTHGGAEDVLALRPDLIVATPGRRIETAAQLRRFGPRTVELPLEPAKSYADIRTNIRLVADAVGHPERGDALIARMDADLAALPRANAHGRVAAYYQRRGYLTGAGTLVDDLMRRVGLTNLAARLGKPALSRIGLEEMALAHPDYLLVETATDRIADQGTEMLHHPVLADIARLRLPAAWTVCGGPAYVRAARALARQIGTGA